MEREHINIVAAEGFEGVVCRISLITINFLSDLGSNVIG